MPSASLSFERPSVMSAPPPRTNAATADTSSPVRARAKATGATTTGPADRSHGRGWRLDTAARDKDFAGSGAERWRGLYGAATGRETLMRDRPVGTNDKL